MRHNRVHGALISLSSHISLFSGNPSWSEEEKDGKLEDAFQVFCDIQYLIQILIILKNLDCQDPRDDLKNRIFKINLAGYIHIIEHHQPRQQGPWEWVG